MNIDRWKELRDFIATSKWSFEMGSSYVSDTSQHGGCWAAHAARLWPECHLLFENRLGPSFYTFNAAAVRRKLDISGEVFDFFCYECAALNGNKKALLLLMDLYEDLGFVPINQLSESLKDR